MIILTEELKKKFIRDLSKDPNLSDYTFVFKGHTLHCISQTDGTSLIHYDSIPEYCNYNLMLNSAIDHLCKQKYFFKAVRTVFKSFDYDTLLQKIHVYKSKERIVDCSCFYEMNGYFFEFDIHAHLFNDPLQEIVAISVTQDVLDAHGVDIDTFFRDVAECYLKDGIDILSDWYPAF